MMDRSSLRLTGILPTQQGTQMGLTYADLILTNTFTEKSVQVRALVDTGALHLCIPEAIARELGFDPTEVQTARLTIADARRVEVHRVAPITIAFANRDCVTSAYVLGDEPLLGVIPIEDMDCVVDPTTQRLVVNPAHPDYPVFRA